MHTHSNNQVKHIGIAKDPAGHIDVQTALKPGNTDKAFATLAAQFALAGHSVIRGNPADGAAAYFVMRWGFIKVLPTLDAARAFLAQIGGAQ